jgi:conjugal transfer pilus assembly protein TraK
LKKTKRDQMKTQRFIKLSGLLWLILIKTSLVCAQQNTQDASAQNVNIVSPTKAMPAMPMNSNKNGNSTPSNTTADSALKAVERANISKKIKDEITSAITTGSTTQNKKQSNVKQSTTSSDNYNSLPPEAQSSLKPVAEKTGSPDAKHDPQKETVSAASTAPAALVVPVDPVAAAVNANPGVAEQSNQEVLSIEKQQQEKDHEKTATKAPAKTKKAKKVAVEKPAAEVLVEDWSEGSQISADDTKDLPGVKTIPFTNNERLNITLSNKDINRIIVKGDKIQSINGSSGYYSAKNDQQGAAYVNTFGESSFTIFISTVKGHSVSLLVQPGQLSGKTIILMPNSQPEMRWEQADSYQKSLAALMTQMINNTETEDYDVRLVKRAKTRNFYNIAAVKTLVIYDGSYLYGAISEIKNISKKPITLKPSYFYEPGVRAVALSEQTIPRGSSGLIYRIMGK